MNIGILAHVDAGKTSLTERLLFDHGAIARLGRVDEGTTQTDSLDLERHRGITIRTAVAAFQTEDRVVNLIDTPGHADFIAEVERALRVLDGAVLVVSATSGVQPQTRILLRTLTRLRVPTLLFVNKTDRPGWDRDRLLADIRRLTPSAVPVTADTDTMAEILAEHDDRMLESYVDGSVAESELDRALVEQTALAHVQPLFFGSAVTGAGVAELVRGIRRFVPPSRDDGTTRATVFKIERGEGGQRVAYLRVHSGSVAVREEISAYRPGSEPVRMKITAMRGIRPGASEPVTRLHTGEIAQVWGLAEAHVGDQLGSPPGPPTGSAAGSPTGSAVGSPAGSLTGAPVGAPAGPQIGAVADRPFAPPALGTVVTVARAADRLRLHAALRELADQDPLIGLDTDELTGQLSLRIYGEVQQEVIQSRLREEFGVVGIFAAVRPVYIERPTRRGEAVHRINPRGPNDIFATVGLRVEPLPPTGSPVAYRVGVEPGLIPKAFHAAIEETVHQAARRGPHGWPVLDCQVTLTAAGYAAPLSVAADFRTVTAQLLDAALRDAETEECEPISAFELELPEDTAGRTLTALAAAGATAAHTTVHRETATITGEIPAAQAEELRRRLPRLTRGEAVFTTIPAGYRPRRGRAGG